MKRMPPSKHKYCFWFVCLLFFHCGLPKFCGAQCNLGSITFNVVASPEPEILGNPNFCLGGFTTLTLNEPFTTYDWSTGSTDPSIMVNTEGIYTVTVTNAAGCTGMDDFVVFMPTPLVVVITPLTDPVCEGDTPFLLEAFPTGGVWSGDVDASGLLDPIFLGVGSFSALYTYTDPNGCIEADQINFDILPITSVLITQVGPFCATDPVQVLNATPAGGTWGGAANAAGEVDPVALGPGSHIVTYSATEPGRCEGEAEITIEIYETPTGSIMGNGIVCQGSGQNINLSFVTTGNGPFELTYTLNGASPTTLNVPLGVTNIFFTTPGLYEISSIVDANGCSGTTFGQSTIVEIAAPQVAGPDIQCIPGQNTYTVSFEITGGDPPSYSITSSIPGTLTPNPPYIFTSNAIPSGTPYEFVVTDVNGCNSMILQGTFNCACETEIGTMDLTPLQLCDGETATAIYNGGETLDANDLLVYILHSGNSNTLGTIFQINTSPVFDFAAPLGLGQTYYISAVAGDDVGNGMIDLNDPCLSVSIGTPVTWTALPIGSLSDDVDICVGESATLFFSLTGDAPFNVIYSDGTQQFVLQNIFNNYSITVSPAVTTTYTLELVEDSSPAGCSSSPFSIATVTAHQPITQNAEATICEGESILLAGMMQTEPGIYTDIFPNSTGCDSIVITTLVVNTVDTVTFSTTSCDSAQVGVFTETFPNQNGCDSTVVTTVTFSEVDSTFFADTTCDPALVGVFVETFPNQLGCDSVATTTVSLLPADTTALSGTSCDPTQVGVFSETFPNQNGCDSTVITTVTFSEVDSTFFADTTCDPALAGVFVETFPNQLGCDSVVTTTVSLLPADTTALSGTSCDSAQVGVFEETFPNQLGCDSVVITTIVFSEMDSVFLTDSTCDPALAGVFEEIFSNQNGCDSVVTTIVDLLPSDQTDLVMTSCDPMQVGVFTEVFTNQFDCDSIVTTTVTFSAIDSTFFFETTCDPAAAGVFSEIFTNQFGCDSVATTTVSLLPPDQTAISSSSCDPSQVGVFTEILTNQYGCDSTVILTVSLLPSDETFLTDTTCDPTQAGVFTETFPNQNGCDSVVTTTFMLLPTDETFLTNTTCDPTQAGVFTETLTNQNGCDSVVITNVSLLAPGECNVVFSMTADPIPCGSLEGSILIDVSLGQMPLDYSIIGPTGFSDNGIVQTSPFMLSQLPVGQYTLTLTLPNGISSTEAVEIIQATPPVVSIDLINGLDCSGVAIGALTANASGDFPPYNFLWSNGATTPGVSNLGAGTFGVTVSDIYGCESMSEMTIAAPSNVEMMFTVNNPDCFDANGGYVQVEAMGGDSPYLFSFNGSDFQNDNFFSGLSAGAYQVVVQDANGCEVSESFAINAPILADVELGDDMTIQLGDGATINAIVNLPDSLLSGIDWSGLGPDPECPTCLTQTTIPLVTTTYSISIESADGCIDSDDMTIFVDKNRYVFIPNAFSPNGDGVNDIFYPFAKANAVGKIHSFLIFSRWGESVFEAYDFQPNDPDHGWDGRHKGDPMQPAVFVWFAEIEFIDGQVVLFEGDVVLVR